MIVSIWLHADTTNGKRMDAKERTGVCAAWMGGQIVNKYYCNSLAFEINWCSMPQRVRPTENCVNSVT